MSTLVMPIDEEKNSLYRTLSASKLRGSFEKFVDWRQCPAVMQRKAVTVMPSCSGGVT
jgi:hypothetical protein